MIDWIVANETSLLAIVAGLIATASAVANFVPNSGFAKAVHWVALNFNVQKPNA